MKHSLNITVAVLPSPYILEINMDKNGKAELGGYEGRFLHAVLTNLGYQYFLVVPEDGEYGRIKPDKNWTGKKRRYMNILYKLYASLLRQPLNLQRTSVQLDLLLCFWWIYIFVIPSLYCAVLLSFLAVPLQDNAIETFQELSEAVQSGSHKCYALKGTIIITSLMNSQKEYLRNLGNAIYHNEWYFTGSYAKTEKYLSDYSAILSTEKKLRMFFSTDPDLIVSEDRIFFWPSAFAIKKDFCCKSKLNEIILRFSAAGLFHKFLIDESIKYRISASENTSEEKMQFYKSLSVNDLAGVFLLLSIAYGFSVICLLLEIVCFRLTITNQSKLYNE
ncbi:hypothetical protein AVEN_273931-1 [Araneus ventricosus]|uniref:Ionotropic glutamate receptor C-terminal domain-containing protein n=1 Tax=Araneus ventricosus TaxID=182803 RepID=A0A4Y2I1F9_ARAVE|nr:hypothetical protein AVEN_273931-1 [Araneus ventricosus]